MCVKEQWISFSVHPSVCMCLWFVCACVGTVCLVVFLCQYPRRDHTTQNVFVYEHELGILTEKHLWNSPFRTLGKLAGCLSFPSHPCLKCAGTFGCKSGILLLEALREWEYCGDALHYSQWGSPISSLVPGCPLLCRFLVDDVPLSKMQERKMRVSELGSTEVLCRVGWWSRASLSFLVLAPCFFMCVGVECPCLPGGDSAVRCVTGHE